MPTKKESKTNPVNESSYSRLYRSETDKVIAGVAGGLGEYFNIDPTIIRVLFVLLTIFGGSGVIMYIILWLVIPTRSQTGVPVDLIKSNIEDMKSTTSKFAHDIRINKKREDSKFWWAIIIIALGFLFLLGNYGVLNTAEFNRLWPLILILFGLTLILRK